VPHFSVLAEVVATTDLILSAPSRIASRFAAGHAIRVFDLPFNVRKLEIMLRWQEHSGDIVVQRWLCQVLRESIAGL
jgi:DNA-binding transcriptional LysR family regulator